MDNVVATREDKIYYCQKTLELHGFKIKQDFLAELKKKLNHAKHLDAPAKLLESVLDDCILIQLDLVGGNYNV